MDTLIIAFCGNLPLYIGPSADCPAHLDTIPWQTFCQDCPVMSALLRGLADGVAHYL
jgi:hypothetical protein